MSVDCQKIFFNLNLNFFVIKAGLTMPEVTVKVRKVLNNPLLQRQQCVVDVLHPGCTYESKEAIKAKVAQQLKVPDQKNIVLYGFKTSFGGGHTVGFCNAYQSMDALMKCEPGFRKIRCGLMEAPKPVSRKQLKNLKNRRLKKRGTEKATVTLGAKK
ncbi:SSU ribosomal protein S24E [Giardia duodenalis assemblage B]|uniref:SSU ribosomal protein S24E n=2 Tax=Giardia intestinalis TaxID=5741 RepID=A0A132NRV1_GIAIN|nr:SSU ribosomal protein S24E [Giardia intestinalis assemblage B]